MDVVQLRRPGIEYFRAVSLGVLPEWIRRQEDAMGTFTAATCFGRRSSKFNDFDCSIDYLINEAMRYYARSKNYQSPGAPGGNGPGATVPPPMGNPALGKQRSAFRRRRQRRQRSAEPEARATCRCRSRRWRRAWAVTAWLAATARCHRSSAVLLPPTPGYSSARTRTTRLARRRTCHRRRHDAAPAPMPPPNNNPPPGAMGAGPRRCS